MNKFRSGIPRNGAGDGLDAVTREDALIHHRTLFDDLAIRLQVRRIHEWYEVTKERIVQVEPEVGDILARYYHRSVVKAITLLYPEHDWMPWLFTERVPPNYWKEPIHQKKFMEYLARRCTITAPHEWYNITARDIMKHGGHSLLKMFQGSTSAIVMAVY